MAVSEDDVLVSLTQSYLEGRIVENAPPNSTIDGLHNISLSVTNFQGRCRFPQDSNQRNPDDPYGLEDLEHTRTALMAKSGLLVWIDQNQCFVATFKDACWNNGA